MATAPCNFASETVEAYRRIEYLSVQDRRLIMMIANENKSKRVV